MPESERPASRPPELENPFDGLMKSIGAVFEALAEAFDPGSTPGAADGTRASNEPPIIRERTPIVDVFDEGGDLLVVLELPGVQPEQIRIDVQDDIFALEIVDEPRSREEILLPDVVNPLSLRWTYRNGILEARLERLQRGG